MKQVIFRTYKFNSFALIIGGLTVLSALCNSCEDDLAGKTFLTTDDLMIDDYITAKDPAMTAFLEIADKAGFRGMLHAYGTYTCFVPSNDAIQHYLQGLGKSSVNDLSEEECAYIVKYHVVEDTLMTSRFVDGRLQVANMLVKYLTTRTVNVNGTVSLEVNRQAIILQKDIRAANGYIHKIDHVLIPNMLTCGEQILRLPEEYSLFKSIFQKTGWIDTLTQNTSEDVWYTILLHDNEAFASVGIRNEADLLNLLRVERADITDDDSLLWTFSAYHCIKGLYYVADLSNTSALQSLAPNQALTFKLTADSLLVNEYSNLTSGIFEKGIAVNKTSEYTDYSCYNGVLIDVKGYVGPKKRKAQAVYWDVAEQPELIKDSRFRNSAIPINDNLSELTVTLQDGRKWSDLQFEYSYQAAYANNWAVANHDYLNIRWARIKSMELTLPLLSEGAYYVWFCYRRSTTGTMRLQSTFIQDEQEDQTVGTVVVYSSLNTTLDPEVLLTTGMKRYTAKNKVGEVLALRWGIIDVKTTGRHKLRIDVIDKGTDARSFIDMIQFIPIEEDQLWPRFDMEGKAVYPETLCKDIWPYDQGCSADVPKE